ncbi:MAG: 30S ribosomal protein S4, partial [Cyanobacteria bacterium J06626_23]
KVARKAYPPGQHGQARKKKSDYAVRLEEKQKLRYNYGVTERQLLRYVKKARRAGGSTGQLILQQLEMRLDNTIFRLGMAPTIPSARQVVNHGHITVNGRVVSIPSYQCRPGDVITVRDKDASRKMVEANLEFPGLANVPSHLAFDKSKMQGTVNGIIEREWIALNINELLVVEYYSKK